MERPTRPPRVPVCPPNVRATLARSVPCPASPPSAIRGRPWRCRSCDALLGVEHDGELHVKHKETEHWISGRCRHACRRCGAMNTFPVPPDDRATLGEGGRP